VATESYREGLRQDLPVIQSVLAEEIGLTELHDGDDFLAHYNKLDRLMHLFGGGVFLSIGLATTGLLLELAASCTVTPAAIPLVIGFELVGLGMAHVGQASLTRAFAEYLAKVPQPPQPPKKSLLERARELVESLTQPSPVPMPIPVR
jgi:hypothetical protein